MPSCMTLSFPANYHKNTCLSNGLNTSAAEDPTPTVPNKRPPRAPRFLFVHCRQREQQRAALVMFHVSWCKVPFSGW